jgi:hypothetical protein
MAVSFLGILPSLSVCSSLAWECKYASISLLRTWHSMYGSCQSPNWRDDALGRRDAILRHHDSQTEYHSILKLKQIRLVLAVLRMKRTISSVVFFWTIDYLCNARIHIIR